MKKYIRDIIDDLKGTKNKDFIPPVPKSPTDGKTVDLNQTPQPDLTTDLNNQILSGDQLEMERQLDQQAQKHEETEALG
jgi:hypothetical protein